MKVIGKNKRGKPKPLTHELESSSKPMKDGTKSHIISYLPRFFDLYWKVFALSFFLRRQKPRANIFPHKPHTRLVSNQYIHLHTHTYRYMQTYTHTHTHTHTHTYT